MASERAKPAEAALERATRLMLAAISEPDEQRAYLLGEASGEAMVEAAGIHEDDLVSTADFDRVRGEVLERVRDRMLDVATAAAPDMIGKDPAEIDRLWRDKLHTMFAMRH